MLEKSVLEYYLKMRRSQESTVVDLGPLLDEIGREKEVDIVYVNRDGTVEGYSKKEVQERLVSALKGMCQNLYND